MPNPSSRNAGTCLAGALLSAWIAFIPTGPAAAQTAPSTTEIELYTGLHAAAWSGDLEKLRNLLGADADVSVRDSSGRTALHVAAFAGHDAIVRTLVEAGADPNALENDRYDIVTIAAVANDLELLETALSLGGDARNTTSPYDGTALIAAAHLGHGAVVDVLIAAGAPLNHINNLGWTALIEAVILGDGGHDHIEIVKALVRAGADKDIKDRQGQTALDLARARGYEQMVSILQ